MFFQSLGICGGGGGRGDGVVVGVSLVLVGYWWWHCRGGSGGDSLCKGGSCNSCRSALFKCMMCDEGVGESCNYGGGGIVGSGGVNFVGGGQDRNH